MYEKTGFNHWLILHMLKYKIPIDFELEHWKTLRQNLLKSSQNAEFFEAAYEKMDWQEKLVINRFLTGVSRY